MSLSTFWSAMVVQGLYRRPSCMNDSSCWCRLQVVLEQEPHSQAAASHQLPVAIHASLELLDRQVDILARKLLQVHRPLSAPPDATEASHATPAWYTCYPIQAACMSQLLNLARAAAQHVPTQHRAFRWCSMPVPDPGVRCCCHTSPCPVEGSPWRCTVWSACPTQGWQSITLCPAVGSSLWQAVDCPW